VADAGVVTMPREESLGREELVVVLLGVQAHTEWVAVPAVGP
jgi:hypothetical protein